MTTMRHRTRLEIDNDNKMKLVKRYFYKKTIKDKTHQKLEQSQFRKDHMSINKYLTYQGDKVYIKNTALKRLILESQLKWKDL